MMSAYLKAHNDRFARQLLMEMIDNRELRLRKSRARASLIFNPISGQPYPVNPAASADSVSEEAASR